MERVYGLTLLVLFVVLGLAGGIYYLVDRIIFPSLPPSQTIEVLKLDELRLHDDLILDDNMQPIGFYLGEFDDISNFSTTAQNDFKRGIRYFVYPTRDCKDIAAIKIPKVECSDPVIFSSNDMLEDKDYNTHGNRYYGPIMFRRGETWKIWGTLPKDNKYTGGWQPICYHFKVGLTPKAKEKANNLLKFLQDMRNLRYSQGRFEKGNGTSINEQELQIAIDYDIIETERKFLFFKEPVGISNKYKTVQRYLNSKEK